jgi:ABC-2 type transport system permease protein
MNDIWTMIWKETKDSIFSGGRGAWIRPLIFIFLLGMLTPWQLGQRWLALSSTPIAVLVACYLPFFFITSYIGDAIAGERERHTLETLLASRLSDQAILWGKLVVTVGYNFGLTIIGLLIGFVVANLPQGQGNWTFYYPLDILGETLLLSLLISLVAASGGALISLRAVTVRQAQQTMSVGVLVLFIVIVFVLKAIPAAVLQSLNISQFLLLLIGGFFILDLILISILAANFQRSRLILS